MNFWILDVSTLTRFGAASDISVADDELASSEGLLLGACGCPTEVLGGG
jgi:hypothetical protein